MSSTPEQEQLARDEERRISQHEAVKGRVREELHESLERTQPAAAEQSAGIATLSRSLKDEAIREVALTESELVRSRRVARVSQVVDYLFYVLYGIIGLQVSLEALGAREASGFKRLVDAISAPFLRPFRGLFPDPAVGGSHLMFSYLFGLIAFVLLHLAIRGLLRVVAFRRTTV